VKPGPCATRASLLIHLLPERKLALVNEIDLDEFLKGVVGRR
jgi:hypothetical protein